VGGARLHRLFARPSIGFLATASSIAAHRANAAVSNSLTLTQYAHRTYPPGMDRRRFLLTSLAGVIAAPLVAGAQQAGTVSRIGFPGMLR